MDANKMNIKAINEGIQRGNYALTGILKTGEVTLTLLTDLDKEILKELEGKNNKEAKLKKIIKLKNRPALEWEQVFKQEFDIKLSRCFKNNLILKD